MTPLAERRRVLLAAAALPVIAWASPASATDYTSAEQVLDAVDAGEAQVEQGLLSLARRIPGAGELAHRVLGSHEVRRKERAALRRRLGLAVARPTSAAAPQTLATLREAQEALVHAHAEGLPALKDAAAVDLLARHMVDAAAHLTVLDLWLELEAQRAG